MKTVSSKPPERSRKNSGIAKRSGAATIYLHLRSIHFKDPETEETLVFLINLFGLLPTYDLLCTEQSSPACRIALQLDHRIKKFYGMSVNAVKLQIRTAVSVNWVTAIITKRFGLNVSLYTLLRVFSVTLFEKIPINKDFSIQCTLRRTACITSN